MAVRYRKEIQNSFSLDFWPSISRQAINSAKDIFVVQSSTMTGVQRTLNIPDASGHKNPRYLHAAIYNRLVLPRLLSRYFTVKRYPAGERVQKFT